MYLLLNFLIIYNLIKFDIITFPSIKKGHVPRKRPNMQTIILDILPGTHSSSMCYTNCHTRHPRGTISQPPKWVNSSRLFSPSNNMLFRAESGMCRPPGVINKSLYVNNKPLGIGEMDQLADNI